MDEELQVPPDRGYGRIEMMVIEAETDGWTPTAPPMTYEQLVEQVMGRMRLAAADEGRKPRENSLRFAAKRAIASVLARATPDLVLSDDGTQVLRTADYLKPGLTLVGKYGCEGRDPLLPRSGYFAARFRAIPRIVAEEDARLADGVTPAGAVYGEGGIPPEWREGLVLRDLIESLATGEVK